MLVVINGTSFATNAATLLELVVERGHEPSSIATALNGKFVTAVQRHKEILRQGDAIEIESARQGG